MCRLNLLHQICCLSLQSYKTPLVSEQSFLVEILQAGNYILTIFSNLPWFYLASLTVRACAPGSIAVSSPDLPAQQDDLKKVFTPNLTPHKNLEILTTGG